MRRSGFTLVEMMIVVAIVLILAAVAIPLLNERQLVAKRAELLTNLDGIGSAWMAYCTASVSGGGPATGLPDNPGGTPGKTARPWDSALAGWSELGFQPDGNPRGNYRADAAICSELVDSSGLFCLPSRSCFQGYADVDGDGGYSCADFYITTNLKTVSGVDLYKTTAY